jgi:hypothetical protein
MVRNRASKGKVLEHALYLAGAVTPAGFGTILQAPGSSSGSAVASMLKVRVRNRASKGKALEHAFCLSGDANRLWRNPASNRRLAVQLSAAWRFWCAVLKAQLSTEV